MFGAADVTVTVAPMQRLRELFAAGGIAILAVVFALASATVFLGNAIAQVVVWVLVQTTGDEFGDTPFDFTIADTSVDLTSVFQEAIVVALVLVTLFVAWRLTRPARRTCSECLSDIPVEAAICRYCTSELRDLANK